jgi:hypothetical protein
VATGRPLQRLGQETQDRGSIIRERAANSLVKTQDDGAGCSIEKARPQNIAHAAPQYEIIVPLAHPQHGPWKALGKLRPSLVEQRQIGVQRGVLTDVG